MDKNRHQKPWLVQIISDISNINLKSNRIWCGLLAITPVRDHYVGRKIGIIEGYGDHHEDLRFQRFYKKREKVSLNIESGGRKGILKVGRDKYIIASEESTSIKKEIKEFKDIFEFTAYLKKILPNKK